MFTQILHLIICIGVHGFGLLARFVAYFSTSLSILVSRVCVLYHNFYCIFSCYLRPTQHGVRHLNSCAWGYNQTNMFLGDINTGTWPSRLVESRIWHSKMWSWVPRDSDLRMTALARPAAIVNNRRILLSERMLHKDYNRKCPVGKKLLVVSLKGLVAMTNWLAVNRQS
jgi:hypothetical protein